MQTDGRWWISNGVVWTDTLGEQRKPAPPFRPVVVAGDTAEFLRRIEEDTYPSPKVLTVLRKLWKRGAFLC